MENSKATDHSILEGTTTSIDICLTGFLRSPAAAHAAYRATLDWFADWDDAPENGALGGGRHRGMRVRAGSVARTLEKDGFDRIWLCDLWSGDQPKGRARTRGMYSGAVFMARAEFSVTGQARPIKLEALIAPLRRLLATLGSDVGEITLAADNEVPLEVPGHSTNSKDFILANLEAWHSHPNPESGPPRWRCGQLGTVNTLNLLPAVALESRIAGRTLREWILADTARGRLLALSAAVTLWVVETSQRTALFKALWDAGILFDSTRYYDEVVWREIPDALLEKRYDRKTLRAVIETHSFNGVLEALPDRRHRWGLPRGSECQLIKLKSEFNFISDVDGNLVDGPRRSSEPD
jgi:hypothetical protein